MNCTADTDEYGCECSECAAFWQAQDAQIEAEIMAESAYEASNDEWAGQQE